MKTIKNNSQNIQKQVLEILTRRRKMQRDWAEKGINYIDDYVEDFKFWQLDLPPSLTLGKAIKITKIYELIKQQLLTVNEITSILNIPQNRVEKLINKNFDDGDFDLEELSTFVDLLSMTNLIFDHSQVRSRLNSLNLDWLQELRNNFYARIKSIINEASGLRIQDEETKKFLYELVNLSNQDTFSGMMPQEMVIDDVQYDSLENNTPNDSEEKELRREVDDLAEKLVELFR